MPTNGTVKSLLVYDGDEEKVREVLKEGSTTNREITIAGVAPRVQQERRAKETER